VGQYEAVSVDSDLTVEAIHNDAVARTIDADRVLVGGGLPDEAIDVMHRPAVNDRLAFEDVDLCRHDGGSETVVWLAP